MKSAAGFLSVWFSLFARLFRPFSYLEARGSSYFPSEHTVYPPAFFSLCVRNSFLLRSLFVRIFLYALSLRENCLVTCFMQNLLFTCFVRNLLHLIYSVTHAALKIESSTHNDVLVIRCIIIRRCISGRFICICRLVCGITEERNYY